MKAAFAIAVAVLFAGQLQASPVGLWTFSNSGNLGADTSGNGYNLTLEGSGTTYSATAFNGQGAVHFNGSGYFAASSFPSLLPTGNSSYTIAAWIDPSTLAAEYGILGWGDYGTNNAVNALRTADAGQDGYNGIDNYAWFNDLTDTDNNVFDNQWLFVVATYNGTTRTLYIDPATGGPSTSDTPGTLDVGATDFNIGQALSGQTFTGYMADVSIYNTALTDSQIIALQDEEWGSVPEPGTLILFAAPLALLVRRLIR